MGHTLTKEELSRGQAVLKAAPSEENFPKSRGFKSDVNPRYLAGFLPRWTSSFLQDLFP
jgi:hypothetical protein